MSNRELVLDLVSKLPEDASMDEIVEKIAFVRGVQEGLAESDRGEGVPIEEARERMKAWRTKSS